MSERPGGIPLFAARGAIGGLLMGLANLVPGISGGTMLLAAGVYPAFISAVAELTTLRVRLRPLLLVGTIAGSAALAILLLAGIVKELVVEHRWAMYSLFIGLTLGGVPLVWRLARPASSALYLGAGFGFGVMLVMKLAGSGDAAAAGPNTALLFLSGLAGASAMILPGVSGGYLLLLLGQYETILGAIDQMKQGLLGEVAAGFQFALEAMSVVLPVGVGVLAGVVGVSNLLKWLLARFEKATLGALLGLLLGAVVGLWPFQEAREPRAGDVVQGRILTAEQLAALDMDDWPVATFEPTEGEVLIAMALILAGLGTTLLISRLGGDSEFDEASPRSPAEP